MILSSTHRMAAWSWTPGPWADFFFFLSGKAPGLILRHTGLCKRSNGKHLWPIFSNTGLLHAPHSDGSEIIYGPSLCWLQKKKKKNVRPARRRSCLSFLCLAPPASVGKKFWESGRAAGTAPPSPSPVADGRGPCRAEDEAGEQLGLGRSAISRREAVARGT